MTDSAHPAAPARCANAPPASGRSASWRLRPGTRPQRATLLHPPRRPRTRRGTAARARRRPRATRLDATTVAGRTNVGELLERFLAGPHHWQPATLASHTHVVGTLLANRFSQRRLATLTPCFVRATIRRWQQEGLPAPTVSGRWLVLRSALSWAVDEELLPTNPLAGMRGPPRPIPRRHHTLDEVFQLLSTAEAQVAAAEEAVPARSERAGPPRTLFTAEQNLLLGGVAADSGARRWALRGVDAKEAAIARG